MVFSVFSLREGCFCHSHQCEWWRELLFPSGSRTIPDGWRWVPVGSRGDDPFFPWHLFEFEEEKGQGQDLNFCSCVTWLVNFWICSTLVRRQNNEVIPVPLQKSHAAVNSLLSVRHGEAFKLVLSITFIWWVKLWQGADLLFNILGGFFWCVGNMFAEILGVEQDVFICFDGFLWRQLLRISHLPSTFHPQPAPVWTQRLPWVFTKWGSVSTRERQSLEGPPNLRVELKRVFPSLWLPLSSSKQRWCAKSPNG